MKPKGLMTIFLTERRIVNDINQPIKYLLIKIQNNI